MRNDEFYSEIINEINDNEIKEYIKQQLMLDTPEIVKGIEQNYDGLVNQTMERFKRNPDIYDEFKYAFYNMKNHNYESDILCFAVEDPVTEQGYRSYDLYHEFGNKISPIGIFDLLISLREEPKETLDYIKRGLPRN